MTSPSIERLLPNPVVQLLDRAGTRQMLRYVIGGVCVTQATALAYSLFAAYFGVAPLRANVLSTAGGVMLGYVVHDNWSFAEGKAQNHLGKMSRFAIATVLAFAINSFWVWLLTSEMHLSPLAPVPMMMFVTPWASFFLNRYWVFEATGCTT